MKIVHLSTVTRGTYLTKANETLTLWLTKDPTVLPDDKKYMNGDGTRNLEKSLEDWQQCTRQSVPVVDKIDDVTEEIRLDSRGFPIFTFVDDVPQTKAIVFENYNSQNSGITDMYLLVENEVCRWAILNDLGKCIGCSGFGDLAGTGKFVEDPNL